MHPPILETRHLTWLDEAACGDFAADLSRHAALRDAIIELSGPLGAGKTTFVRHLLRALGVQGRIKSPTYAVVEPYEVDGLAISHFDFYRFDDPREWEDAGFRDVFGRPGLKLVEWADKAASHLPPPDLALHIRWPGGEAANAGHPVVVDDTVREVDVEAFSPVGRALLAAASPSHGHAPAARDTRSRVA
jgi:tRNA threonylcarbamoyladenosine biosynthesis protein TsaE